MMELGLSFSHSQILPDWSLPEDGAVFEEDSLDLNHLDIFDADDLLPPWMGTDDKAKALLSENLQDFWSDSLHSSCKQKAEALLSEKLQDFWGDSLHSSCKQNDGLTNNQLEDNLSSTFLSPTPQPSTVLKKPNDLLTEGFEDLWEPPHLREDISDITNGSLDESSPLITDPPLISSLSLLREQEQDLITSSHPPSLISSLSLLQEEEQDLITPSHPPSLRSSLSLLREKEQNLIPSSHPPALITSPTPFLLEEHNYSQSPSLLPTNAKERKSKTSAGEGKSILKKVTGKIHIADIIQDHKNVLRLRPINHQPKKKKHSKKKHNERERFRRGHLKLDLERLRDLLPSVGKSKRPPKKRDS